ncbi:MAG TPA: hypothetical protein VMJ90_06360 [Anaerolineales bacterium]|nr:hypothetical protein [Anaerolineales bacterium]
MQRQIESAQPEKRFVTRKRKRGIHPFPVDLHADDFQVRVHAPEPRGTLEGCTRIEAIAEVNKHRIGEPAIGPREKRGLVEQDEVIDAAEPVRCSLAAGGLSIWFFFETRT